MRREWARRGWATVLGAGTVLTAGYLGLVTGAVPVDLRLGRRYQPLGPHAIEIRAAREIVFDILAAPYLGRQSRAMAEKIQVLERGSDMVLAAHRTPVGNGLMATTVETVRFTAPERLDFRLVRGPVPELTETFLLTEAGSTTRLEYDGRLGTDLAGVGEWWGRLVARRWEEVVAETFTAVRDEAQRRSGRG